MSIPGFAPSGGSWQSTVPGWVAPAVDPRVLESPITVTLAGITVESQAEDRQDFRSLHTLEGWWEAPEARIESMSIPDGDGELEGRVLLGPRPISMGGLIVTRNRGALLDEMERFGSILTTGARRGDLVVRETQRGLSRQCRVASVQPPVVVPHSDRVASWNWFLRARDPIRYSDAELSVTLTNKGPDQGLQNAGNTPVKLGLELTGPLVTPSFWIGGAEWRLSYTIPAGRTVVVTWGDRSVMYGTNDLRYYQSGPWPLLQPGMTMVGFSAVSGTGTCKVIWRSGWL